MIAVGADSAESTDDIVVAELCEWIGAQTVSAVVIGKAGLAVDDQIDVEVGEFMPAVLKQLGVMLDSLGRSLREGDILTATTWNSGEIAGTGIFLEVPVSIETGGGHYNELPACSMLPIFGQLFLDATNSGDLGFGELERGLRNPDNVSNIDVGEEPVNH